MYTCVLRWRPGNRKTCCVYFSSEAENGLNVQGVSLRLKKDKEMSLEVRYNKVRVEFKETAGSPH